MNCQRYFKYSCISLHLFQEDKREEVKEWVLAVSMDQKVIIYYLKRYLVKATQKKRLVPVLV